MTERKLPYRDNSAISQSYNDGIVTVLAVHDEADSGHMPVPAREVRIILHYAERRMGMNRHYQARQNMIDVDRVIRVPRPDAGKIPTTQDIAVTEGGYQYRIDMVQAVPDVYPASLDLTLAKTHQIYEPGNGENENNGAEEPADGDRDNP